PRRTRAARPGARSTCRRGPRPLLRPASPARPSSFALEDRGYHDAVALGLEEGRGPGCVVLAGHEDGQHAAAVGREVLELEVLDVDPLRPERLRDPGEDAGPVGNVDAQPLELPGIAVRPVEHPPPVLRGLRDPAGEIARVAGAERLLELLESPPVVGECRTQLLGVVEEDVDPDPRVRAGDAR